MKYLKLLSMSPTIFKFPNYEILRHITIAQTIVNMEKAYTIPLILSTSPLSIIRLFFYLEISTRKRWSRCCGHCSRVDNGLRLLSCGRGSISVSSSKNLCYFSSYLLRRFQAAAETRPRMRSQSKS